MCYYIHYSIENRRMYPTYQHFKGFICICRNLLVAFCTRSYVDCSIICAILVYSINAVFSSVLNVKFKGYERSNLLLCILLCGNTAFSTGIAWMNGNTASFISRLSIYLERAWGITIIDKLRSFISKAE